MRCGDGNTLQVKDAEEAQQVAAAAFQKTRKDIEVRLSPNPLLARIPDLEHMAV